MEAGKGWGKPLIITGEAAEARGPGEGALDYPTSRQEHKASLGFGEFYYFQADSVLLAGRGGIAPRVTLIHIREFDVLLGHLLDSLREFRHLRAILLIRGRDFDRQQIAQRVHRDVNFGAFAPLVSVVASTRAALRRRLHRAAVEDRRARLAFAPLHHHPQNRAQIVRHRFEDARPNPPLRLVVNRFPRRKVCRNHPPRTARSNHPTQRIEEFSQPVISLRSVLAHQGQIRQAKLPFFVTDVTWITALLLAHPERSAGKYLQSTALSHPKVRNRLSGESSHRNARP